MKNSKIFDSITQFALPWFTLWAQIVFAMKYPQYGLILNLMAQPFWLYASWKSYKEAGQTGILVNTIAFTIITIFWIINYWFLTK